MLRRKLLTGILAGLLVIAAGAWSCNAPSWLITAEGIAKIAFPIAGSLLSVVMPQLTPIVTLVEEGFLALTNTLDAYNSQPTQTNLQAVQAALAAISANLTQLENSAQIKDPATDARIKAIVALISQSVAELAALIPQTPSAMAGGVRSRAAQAKGLDRDAIKGQYNSIVAGDSRFSVLQ